MKNIKIFAVMAMVMVFAATMLSSCGKDEFMDDLGRSNVNLPTPQMGWNDSIIGYMPCGNADELEYHTRDHKVFKGVNPFRMSGNTFVRQGNSDLSSTQSQMAVSANPLLWPYNHSIIDTLGRINDTVVVTIYVGSADSVEARTFKVAPMVSLKVYMEIEHSHPTGAAGFVDNAKMAYTLATASSAAEWCCKWQSKATIYEKVEDTTYIDTTTRRKVDEVAHGYHRAWIGNWGGTGNTRTIQGTNTMVVTSYFNMAPMTEVDSAIYPCSGTLTVTGWHTYSQNMDGRYYFDNNGNIPELGIHATTSWNRGPAIVNGHDYTAFAPMCKHSLGYVDVDGTTATVVTLDGPESFSANWTITITDTTPTPPTPQDTVRLDGQMAYYFESDAYFTSYTNYVRRYGLIVMTDGRVYKTIRKISPLSNVNGGNWYTPSFALYGQTLSSSEMAALPGQIAAGNALALWFEHTSDDGVASNDNTVSDAPHTSNLSIVSYNGEIHYWHVVSTSAMVIANWYGDITLVGQTMSGTSVQNPVHQAEACTSVTINGVVYTGTQN